MSKNLGTGETTGAQSSYQIVILINTTKYKF